MTHHTIEWTWLDESASVSLGELAQASGMRADELAELVEYGALAPLPTGQAEPLFSAACVPPLRTAGRLRQDYDLDLFTVVLLMDSLRRIEALERQVRMLEAARGTRT